MAFDDSVGGNELDPNLDCRISEKFFKERFTSGKYPWYLKSFDELRHSESWAGMSKPAEAVLHDPLEDINVRWLGTPDEQ